jgi:hypothetical protein
MESDPEISTVLVDSSMFIHLLRQQMDPALELSSGARRMDLATCGMVRMERAAWHAGAPGCRTPCEQFMSVMLYASTDFRMWRCGHRNRVATGPPRASPCPLRT